MNTNPHRSPLGGLLLGLLAWLLASGAGAGAVRAEEEQPDVPAAKGIAWVDGWEAGRVRARREGKLIFLYFGRHAPR